MKKYNYLLLLSAVTAATAFTSCNEDRLDIPQKGVASIEDFYQTDADAESALVTVYSDTYDNYAFMGDVTGWNYSPYLALTNWMADDIVMPGSGEGDCEPERQYHDFRFNTDLNILEAGYKAFYRSIHKCNLLLNNTTPDSEVKKRCIAEAQVMRAFNHLMLAIYWGTPPIVTTVLTAADQPANSESQEFILKWVVDEIDAALALNALDKAALGDKNSRYHAGRIGGTGPCGRELCCATWMKNFISVSTTAARFQDISLNPQKLAGMCAKLKCCLNYEVDDYMEAGRRLPAKDIVLQTQDADYYMFKTDILAGLITYSTDKRMAANLETISAARAHEIIELNKQGEKPLSLQEDGQQQDDNKPKDLLDDDITRFDKSKKKKKRKNKPAAAKPDNEVRTEKPQQNEAPAEMRGQNPKGKTAQPPKDDRQPNRRNARKPRPQRPQDGEQGRTPENASNKPQGQR